jgi:hypothetical protein
MGLLQKYAAHFEDIVFEAHGSVEELTSDRQNCGRFPRSRRAVEQEVWELIRGDEFANCSRIDSVLMLP